MTHAFQRTILLLIAIALLYFILAPIPAFAGHCWDPTTSSYPDSLHTASGDCPPGTPDPGFSPPPPSPRPQGQSGGLTLYGIIGLANSFVNSLFPFIIALAVLFVLWGTLRYITNGANEEKRGEAKMFILWGIIGIFIMVSIWGLVNLVRNSFNLDTAAPNIRPTLPAIPGA